MRHNKYALPNTYQIYNNRKTGIAIKPSLKSLASHLNWCEYKNTLFIVEKNAGATALALEAIDDISSYSDDFIVVYLDCNRNLDSSRLSYLSSHQSKYIMLFQPENVAELIRVVKYITNWSSTTSKKVVYIVDSADLFVRAGKDHNIESLSRSIRSVDPDCFQIFISNLQSFNATLITYWPCIIRLKFIDKSLYNKVSIRENRKLLGRFISISSSNAQSKSLLLFTIGRFSKRLEKAYEEIQVGVSPNSMFEGIKGIWKYVLSETLSDRQKEFYDKVKQNGN